MSRRPGSVVRQEITAPRPPPLSLFWSPPCLATAIQDHTEVADFEREIRERLESPAPRG